ncbi:hypothetical protein QBC47DRAFT_300481 [Echria macrotheca]|uniref:Heterokaryon incompatibility domain-containing protein n=1 Tax=Echria macrotheca TaxID=438768 RepID=A0AAJ0BF14_9PEZI|nr:hypothetical protein QBC47DRAFT_300481 [Echria macrotheca]
MYNVLKLPEDLDTAIRILERVSSKANGEDLQAIEAHIRTLRLRRGDKFPVVFDIPFESISEGPISLAEIPSRRYRFIDARSLADGARLRVLDFEALPEKRYVAMSYVWRGIPPPKGTEPGPTLAIEGASNADPISIDILQIACRATLHMNCNLLWIDGFCIKQGDDDDKAWQIQRMYSIYQHCHACLILPGGLSRLVRLDEETSWVRRAWTLQEALAPSRCEVLYSWTDGPCCLQAIFPAYVDVIVPGRAAMSNMRQLLDISIRGEYYITTLNGDMSSERYPIRLLVNGTEDSVHLHSLIGALDLQGTDGAPSAIWRAAVMRTAYRPVDMVFSIMGLFGVDLDPSKYTASDRTLALVDMMRKLLAKGGRAEWLAIVPQITPGKDLSVLPIIPKPSASGSGLVISEEIGEINASRAAGGLIWWLRNTPRGSIDAEGFLTITAPAISVTRIPVQSDGVPTETHEVKFQDYQGNPWTLAPNPRGCGPYAAKIGNKQNYLSGAYGTWIDKRSVMVMLVDDGYQGGLRILGYAAVVEELTQLPGWKDKVLRLK